MPIKNGPISGGAMEHNESPFEALIREVKEETEYIINPVLSGISAHIQAVQR